MKRPIGIFDSGIGGLTVFKEIRKQFPYEDIIYFGDTARVPYGPKSKNTVIEYSLQNARFLLQQNVKIIVIACNTSSAVAIPYLAQQMKIPVIGVIKAGAITAVKKSKTQKIGVIGTEGTIRSQAYKSEISALRPDADVYHQSCPLFVSLAEEGWENHDVAFTIAEEYLATLQKEEIDTLVLGCTHYPILKHTIQTVMGKNITLVDSAIEIANQLKEYLLEPSDGVLGKNSFYVSDNEEKFKKIAARILEHNIEPLQKVKLFESWFVE